MRKEIKKIHEQREGEAAMTKEQVDQILKTYLQMNGRRAFLDVEIAHIKTALAAKKEQAKAEDYITFSWPLSGMPCGRRLSDQTARAAQRLIDGELSDGAKELRQRLRRLEEEFILLETRIAYADAWLQGVTEEEAWLIRRQMIERQMWNAVARDYQAAFGIKRTPDTLKKLRRCALLKIYQIAG